MKKGKQFTNDDGTRYVVQSKIGEGGFGETYRAFELSETSDRDREVCLKICGSRRDWHGEAFYGELLRGNKRVVPLLDAFVDVSRNRHGLERTYCLVFELIPSGTVDDLLVDHPGQPVMKNEAMVKKEISALLTVLDSMHNSGITHRDIKPSNVFVRSGKLVLGDFGISKMSLAPRHAAVDAYTPAYSPRNGEELRRWGPRQDIFQVALLAASLLTGTAWTTNSLADLQRSDLSEDVKCWIWHATSAKARGYEDALDAMQALNNLAADTLRSSKTPAAINGEYVVLTGKIDELNRARAVAALRSLGAHVQDMVTDQTTLVVRGPVRNAMSEHEGRKLFQVREQRRRGQKIKIISGSQLLDVIDRADD